MPAWEDGIRSGTRAAQPTLTADEKGVLYFVTDEDVLERWGGASWSRIAINAAAFVPYDSGWHYIGGGGEPAFQDSWVNYGSWGDGAFRRIGKIVFMSGLIKNGSGQIVTLPTGYRISSTTNGSNYVYHGMDTPGPNSSARLDVYTNGGVVFNGGSTGWVSLDQLRWITDDAAPA